jgi:hypothetical protein
MCQVCQKHNGDSTANCQLFFGPIYADQLWGQDVWKSRVLWIRMGFNANPDPAFYLNADLDPGSQTNVDPDPDQTFMSKKYEF